MSATITMNPETGTQYSRAELKNAFDMVCNSTNWKMPIRDMISEADKDLVHAAIVFFAGCVPTFSRPTHAGFRGQLVVSAVGYYAAVGA